MKVFAFHGDASAKMQTYFRGLPPKKSPAPGPLKVPLLGVRAIERRNACRGVAGALVVAVAVAAPPTSGVLGVLRPLLFCMVTAVPGLERTVATPFRGGGLKPSLDPSRKISSRI